jgi:hypothetical protein
MRHYVGLGSFLLLAVGFGCSSERAESPVVAGNVEIAPPPAGAKVLGVFTVEVDPQAPAEKMFKVTRVAPDHFKVGGELGSASAAVTVDLATVSFTSGATTWSSPYLDSRVYIENTGTAGYWDEPVMTISGITITSGSETGVITNEESPTQIAAAGGSGHTFTAPSSYAFADTTYGTTATDSAGIHKNYASQYIRFKNTTASGFKFTATLTASSVSTTRGSSIYVDNDNDTWNLEPFGAQAGGDCNDSTASGAGVGPALGCPTSGGASCSTACNDTMACGYTNSCCNDTGSGAKSCTGSGCTCTVSVTSNTDTTLTCASGTYCKLVSDNNASRVTVLACSGTCTLDCSQSPSGGLNRCYMTGCTTSGGTGACTLLCPSGKFATTCTIGAEAGHRRCIASGDTC